MSELVARTGVGPATVRHYLSLGLLPPPYRVAANRFLYDDRHAQALRIVSLLRERRHLGLAEILRILPSLAKVPEEEAFRPEMWDQVIEAHAAADDRAAPGARLLRSGMAAFARHGFAEVTVDDVCRSAKLAKGSFYRHYRSKEELFFAAASAAGAAAGRAFEKALAAGKPSREGDLVEEDATTALGQALRPHLPLILELLALAAQRRPGQAQVAQRLFGDLRGVVRSHLPLAEEGVDRRVVGAALLIGVRHLLGDEAAPDHAGAMAVGMGQSTRSTGNRRG